ncbi:PREDICTED: uncharacterized protein LOC109236717 [Nicotiana attenuata]|uniref:uncharacterized protein LOC109236717 n=1 Tax=Nicotiana attenuata TaxID=49451 RepID=UPI0009053828|nr:PREDICTED: uncharacterized protein LOC109236717 [Nicotiana attenuata]
MQGTYIAREARMQQYLEKVRELVRQFQSWKAVQIPREENAEADALANLASVMEITKVENAIVIHLFHSALDQDKDEYGILPEDKKKSQILHQKATRYCLIRGNLYRKMFGGPLEWCVGPSQTEYVMREVREGNYGNHTGGRSLVKTLISAGNYWPKIEEKAENFLAKCDKCQRYANNMHRPAELLHSVISPWLFMKWGMDIVGLLPQAKGKEIVCDNGPQFVGTKITEFFQSWQIKWITSAPYHLVDNAKTSTGETPFSLVYGTETLIPVEIGEPSTRYTHATEESNEEEMPTNLDLLVERREAVLIRMAAQKQMIGQYYNRKANLRYFKIGVFVLKKVFRSTKTANAGKLSPNWEGPYMVRGIAGKGAYELETMDGSILPSNCNVVHLKKYYF